LNKAIVWILFYGFRIFARQRYTRRRKFADQEIHAPPYPANRVRGHCRRLRQLICLLAIKHGWTNGDVCFSGAGAAEASRPSLVVAMHTEMNSPVRSTSRISRVSVLTRELTTDTRSRSWNLAWRVSDAREHAVKHATSTPLICYAWRDTKTVTLLWTILAILRDATGRSARARVCLVAIQKKSRTSSEFLFRESIRLYISLSSFYGVQSE